MLNNEFEKRIQQDLEELTVPPSDAVWDRVESSLPEKKKRRWLFILLPACFIIATLVIGKYMGSENINKSAIISVKNSDNTHFSENKVLPLPITTDKNEIAVTSENSKHDESVLNTKSGNSQTKNLKNIYDAGKQILYYEPAAQNITNVFKGSKTSRRSRERESVKITIVNPITEMDDLSEGMLIILKSDSVLNTPDAMITKTGEKVADTLFTSDGTEIKQTDTISAVNNLQPDGKKKKSFWNFGLIAGAGISDSKSGFFGNAPFSGDLTSGVPPIAQPGTSYALSPDEPSASVAFSAGIYAERMISNKLSFITGLNYTYQSTKMKVGQYVDSFVNVTGNNQNISTRGYYRNGSDQLYHNKIHLIQLPLMLNYKPVKNWPLFAEAGVTLSYLFSSNALQYNASRNLYYTERSLFNKALVGMQAGIGTELKNLKLGFRMNYSMNSIFKGESGKQFPVTSLLYLQIPFKK